MRPFDPALLRSLPATRGPVALLAAVQTLTGVVSIAQAIVLATVVVRVVESPTGASLTGPLLLLAGLLAARGVLAGAQEYAARVAGIRVAAEVRLATLRHWLTRPEGDRPDADVAVTRAGEGVSQLEPYVSRYLPALVTGAVVPALAVLTLLVVDPWSALIVVLTIPLLPLFAALIGQHTQDEVDSRWGAMHLLAGHFLDVVRGLPTLVGYGRAHQQIAVVREVGDRHRKATSRTLRTAFLSTVALELLATISVAIVAVAVGLRLAYGQMDLLTGFIAILLAPEAYWPVRRVGQEFHNAADGARVLDELNADGVLGQDERSRREKSDPGIPSTLPPVRLDGARYAHPGREVTVDEVSLETPAGPGLTALVGPSGAGKTTVLELIAGLRIPAAGTVSAPPAHLAAQRPVLLPGTVREALLLATGEGDGTPDAALVEALERVGLWEQMALREGLDTRLGEDGFGLSAGQRSRLALARAVLSPAPLVLLDEPTANVALDAIPALHAVIQALARERRVIVVTHDPELAALADQVWELAAPELPASPHRAPAAATLFSHSDQEQASGDGDQDSGAPRTGDTATDPAPGEVKPVPMPTGRAGMIWSCLLGGGSVACGVALTATSGWLIVQASTRPVILTLLVAIVGVRAFGLFRPILRYFERVISHDVALAELADRRAEVYARLIPLTPAGLGRRSRGEVLTAVVRDLDDAVDERVRVTVPAWSTLIATVIGAVLAGWHVPLAGVAVAVGGLLIAGIMVAGDRAEGAAQDRAVALRSTVGRATTAVASRLLPVQAVTGPTGGRDRVLAPVREAEEQQGRAERRLITARAVALAAAWSVVAGTVVAVALATGQAHRDGALSAPFAALVTLIPMALADAWVGVAEIAGARARARAARGRLEAVLERTPGVADTSEGAGPASDDPHLELRGVGARWPRQGEEPAGDSDLDLAPLDLDLPPGSRVALSGPNGVGKSTALAVLARHLDPVTGRYTVDGTDVRALDVETVRSRIAVVDDEPHAFAGPVRANLALAAPDADDAAMLAALDAVDLGSWFDTLPEGLDTPLTGLSGGERARLSIARALLSGRPVVLLDEPTAHLDDATAERALTGLEASRAGTSDVMVLVSHRPAESPRWSHAKLPVPV